MLNWRILWYWILLTVLLFSVLEWLSRLWDKGNPHEQLASVAIIATIIVGIGAWGIRKFHHWRYRRNLFRVGFPDQWPAPPNVEYAEKKTIRQGENEVLVGVVLGSPHDIRDFDMRFVRENKWNGGNVPSDIISIVGVRDMLMNLPFERPDKLNREEQVFLWGEPNAAGGMDCHYMQPRRIHTGRALFLTIIVKASQPWEGYLGFRGWDRDSCQVRPKAAFAVIPPMPDTEHGRP